MSAPEDLLASRVQQALAELGEISSGGPGVTRLAYSEEDALSRRWFRDRCEATSLRFQVDSVGNCFASTAAAHGRRALLLGSHMDSVIDAGRYDGTVGVTAGLELASYFAREAPDLPIVAASFACEESTRFGWGTIGSRVLAGELDSSDFPTIRDQEGCPLDEVLDAAGIGELGPTDVDFPGSFSAYLEIHIDQGTVLKAQGTDVGLVTAIAGIHRVSLTLTGEAAHSGARLRSQRRDALVAAAEFISRANARWSELDPSGDLLQLTVGHLTVEPNSANTVPGRVTMTVDIRSPEDGALKEFTAEITDLAIAAGTASNVQVDAAILETTGPVAMSQSMLDVLKCSARDVRTRCAPCVSLAGHDAQVMAGYLPTAMLLIGNPTGTSHSPSESFDPQALRQALAIALIAIPELLNIGA